MLVTPRLAGPAARRGRARALAFALAMGLLVCPPAVATKVAAGRSVDESALRYYAAQQNAERVEAEIRRLKTLHPGWTPPEGLYSGQGWSNPEQDLWDLFAADRLDALRREISRRQAEDPAWQPSEELLAKLARKEARSRLIAASEAGEAVEVLAIVGADPMLLTVEDLDVLWRVAAAYAETGDGRQASELFQLPLSGDVPPDLKRANAQKAIAALPPQEATALLAQMRNRLADARPPHQAANDLDGADLDDLETALARRWIGARLEDANTPPVPPALVERLVRTAANTPADDRLLGWHARANGDHAAALARFERADPSGLDPEATLGRVLSLNDLGRGPQAIALAHAKRTASEPLADIFLALVTARLTEDPPQPIGEGELADFARAVKTRRAAEGAQALGWYAYRAGQPRPAAAWFQLAMDWQGDAKTAEGHVLATLAAGDAGQARTLISTYGARFPQVAKLGRPTAPASASSTGTAGPLAAAHRAYTRGDASGCLRRLDAAARRSSEAELLRGWCLMDLDRPREAARAFARAGDAKGRIGRDAAYGRSLALLRLGDTFEAVEAARRPDFETGRQTEIARAALAQTAARAFQAGDYRATLAALDKRRTLTAEPRDLMLLRGWALLRTGAPDAARAVFTTLDRQLSTRETRAGLAALADGNRTAARSVLRR